jgi:NADH-quinone oxidoreductase subunit H
MVVVGESGRALQATGLVPLAKGYYRNMEDQPIWITFIVTFVIMMVLLLGMAYTTWFERKVLARFQDRLGPTRTGPAGLMQPLADAVKLMGRRTSSRLRPIAGSSCGPR